MWGQGAETTESRSTGSRHRVTVFLLAQHDTRSGPEPQKALQQGSGPCRNQGQDRTPGARPAPTPQAGDKGLGLLDLPQTHHFRIPGHPDPSLCFSGGKCDTREQAEPFRTSGRNTWTGPNVENRWDSGAGGIQRRGLRKTEGPPLLSVCVSDWTFVVTRFSETGLPVSPSQTLNVTNHW